MDHLMVTYLEGLSKQIAEVKGEIKELKSALIRKGLLDCLNMAAQWNPGAMRQEMPADAEEK